MIDDIHAAALDMALGIWPEIPAAGQHVTDNG